MVELVQGKPDVATAPLILDRPSNLILAAIAADEYESMRALLTVHPLRMREMILNSTGISPEFNLASEEKQIYWYDFLKDTEERKAKANAAIAGR